MPRGFDRTNSRLGLQTYPSSVDANSDNTHDGDTLSYDDRPVGLQLRQTSVTSPQLEGVPLMEHVVSERQRRSRRLVAVLALGVLGAAAILGAGIGASANADQTPHKVTLCHATDSYTNPYVSVTVDYNAVVLGGHGSHDGPVFDPSVQNGVKWGDIIPAFDFGPGNQYPGMNLDAVGQSILASNCTLVPSTTTSTFPGA